MLTYFSSGKFFRQSVSPQLILGCEVLISQMKVLYIIMMIEFNISTKGQLFLKLWVSKFGVVDQRSKNDAEK